MRRHTKGSAEVALLLGHAYFKKLWRTDGLREYDTAIKLMPSLRNNAVLVRDTVGALDSPHTSPGLLGHLDAHRQARRSATCAAWRALQESARTRARAAHLAQSSRIVAR